MSIPSPPPRINCPHCQGAIKAPALPPGSRVTCPKCGQTFAIGGPTAVAKPATPTKPALASPPIAKPAAAANPQPAIRHPQSPPTVDPLQLGPVARPAAAKQTELAVVCKLCGTRMYAPLTQVGKTMPCPDCHTVNEILPPKLAPPKPAGPTLDNVEEYQLSDPGDRPKYRPTVAPRGDYAELAEFEPGAHPPGFSRPVAGQGASAPVGGEDDGDDFKLAAPEERIETKTTYVLPPPDPVEREGSLYDGKYDDDLIGENVDPRAPDAWKKSPFVLRIVEFLFYTSTLPRWIAYSVGLAGLVLLGHRAYEQAMVEGMTQVFAIPMFMALVLGGGIVLPPLAASLLAVINDTANGTDEVTSWPNWSPLECLVQAAYVFAAGLVAGLPGIVVSMLLLGLGLDPIVGAFAAGVPIIVSWTALLPIVLYSMLAENSVAAVVSPHTLRSFRLVGEAWMLFYLYSLVIGLFAAVGASLLALSGLLPIVIGAILLLTMAMLYCRLLGRLMWYASEKEAKLAERQTPPTPAASV
ncbi:MAG: hypothetical protein SFU86_04950 [Pirellulaceae bacterium]|nr:hypothetical protein [Pirellulaceae bacterium]